MAAEELALQRAKTREKLRRVVYGHLAQGRRDRDSRALAMPCFTQGGAPAPPGGLQGVGTLCRQGRGARNDRLNGAVLWW